MKKILKFLTFFILISAVVIASMVPVSAADGSMSYDFRDCYTFKNVAIGGILPDDLSETIYTWGSDPMGFHYAYSFDLSAYTLTGGSYYPIQFFFNLEVNGASADNPGSVKFRLNCPTNCNFVYNVKNGVYTGSTQVGTVSITDSCNIECTIDNIFSVSQGFTVYVQFRINSLTSSGKYSFNLYPLSEVVTNNLIIQNQNENTDKILDAGSDVPQPDFDTTNGQIDDTVGQMESIEGQFQIDQDSTQAALDEGNSFWQGSYMQRASVQVKNWIERFADDNTDMSGFFVAAMVLGLCFLIIGRKAGSG